MTDKYIGIFRAGRAAKIFLAVCLAYFFPVSFYQVAEAAFPTPDLQAVDRLQKLKPFIPHIQKGKKAAAKPDKSEAENPPPEKTKAGIEKKLETKKAAAKTKTAKDTRGQKEVSLNIGLWRGQYSVVTSSNTAYVIRDEMTGASLDKGEAGKTVTFAVKNHQLLLNGKPIAAKKLCIFSTTAEKNVAMKVGGEKYRGEIIIEMKNDGIAVINRVSLEDYLKGVVASEMMPDWPQEALKAQAVAARTFSLYTLGKHAADGYDLCATTHCQAYGGIEAEASGASKAVEATAGEIMIYGNKPIYAAFHGDSGGRTADCAEVWGSDEPYLRSVIDPDGSPNRHWQVSITAEQTASKLKASGRDIGTLKKITLSPLDMKKPKTNDRYASGRPAKIVFAGSKATITINGTQARQIFGLKSALFSISDKKNGQTSGHIIVKGGQTLYIDGYGSGHGLGLSQWGAKAMAAKNDYRAILSHYYTGIKFSKIY